MIAQGPKNPRKTHLKTRKLFENEEKQTLANNKYKCDFCGKSFPQPYRKNRHVLEVHKKEKRHNCKFCEKSFFKLSSAKRHELTHVCHETWKCSKCQKVFKDQSSLKYHVEKNVCSSKIAKTP